MGVKNEGHGKLIIMKFEGFWIEAEYRCSGYRESDKLSSPGLLKMDSQRITVVWSLFAQMKHLEGDYKINYY